MGGLRSEEALTVRAIMATGVTKVSIDDTVYSVAEMMAALGISGAPVENKAGKVVGVISQSALTNPRLYSGTNEPLIEDVMTKGIVAVSVDAAAIDAAIAMADHGIHRVFVTDAKDEIVGVVSALDIVRALARGEHLGTAGVRSDSAA